MSEKIFQAQVNYGWGLSLNMTGKAPAVAKRIFNTYADALAYVNDYNDSAIEGLQLAVVADEDSKNNGVYFVEKIGTEITTEDADGKIVGTGVAKNDGILKKVGGTETVTAHNYIEAVKLSETLTVGQLIFVENEYEVDASGNSDDSDETKITYQSGFYIVNGKGSISALGTTSGADDEIGALESRVSAVEGRVTTLENDFETYQTEIGGNLAGKVDMSVYETHVSDFEKFRTSVSNTLDSHAATLTSISTTLTSISSALEDHVSKYGAFTTSVTTSFSEVNTTLNSHSTTLTSISSDLTTHVYTFESYQTEVSGSFAGVSEAIEEVTSSVSTLTSDFNNFKDSITTIDSKAIDDLFKTNSEEQ